MIQTYTVGISCNEVLCEQDTSYRGCLLDRWIVYETPYGKVESNKWYRGPGLEIGGIGYKLIPIPEIEDKQNKAINLAREAEEAANELKRLVG